MSMEYVAKDRFIMAVVEVVGDDLQKHVLAIKEYSKETALNVIRERLSNATSGYVEIYGYLFEYDTPLENFNILTIDEFWEAA